MQEVIVLHRPAVRAVIGEVPVAGIRAGRTVEGGPAPHPWPRHETG